MELRFTQHAKNRMRQLDISMSDVVDLVVEQEPSGYDPEGRPGYIGIVREIRVRVVLAVDKPNLVVSLHERKK